MFRVPSHAFIFIHLSRFISGNIKNMPLGDRTCPPQQVLNPLTGRCVKRNGRLGKQIVANAKPPSCKIMVFERPTPTLKRLVKTAEEQRASFFRIFPWEDTFKDHENTVMFVAVANDQICGWLSTQVYRRYLYINKLSARSAMEKNNPIFKGVGYALFEKAKEYAVKEKNLAFISLFPLNKRVADIYARWGFVRVNYTIPDVLREDGKGTETRTSANMYYVLDPKRWDPDTTRKYEPPNELDELLDHFKTSHKKLLRRLRQRNPTLFKEVIDNLHERVNELEASYADDEEEDLDIIIASEICAYMRVIRAKINT